MSNSGTGSGRESVAAEHPEQGAGERTDTEDGHSGPGEAVRRRDRGGPRKRDYTHERGDSTADTAERSVEKQREIRGERGRHGRSVRSHNPKHRRMGRRADEGESDMSGASGQSTERQPRPLSCGRRPRGQANLAALAAALFALATVTVLGVAIADGALSSAMRDADERHAAATVADSIVSQSSPLTNRSNVLDGGATDELDAATLQGQYPVLDGRTFSVTLDGTTVAADGTADGGATIHRVVLVERRTSETMTPAFSGANRVTLPRRTPWVELVISAPTNVSVSSVRANERTVLHDSSGLDGRYTVDVPRRETVQFTFLANASLDRGDVRLNFAPSNTTKAELGVTVDG